MNTVNKLDDCLSKLGITISSVPGVSAEQEAEWKSFTAKSDKPWTGVNSYTATLRFGKRKFVTGYRMGSAHKHPPKAAEVVSSLISDAESGIYTFEDFCGNFGYDQDSRAAENVWKACVRSSKAFRKFLGNSFSEVAEAAQDY